LRTRARRDPAGGFSGQRCRTACGRESRHRPGSHSAAGDRAGDGRSDRALARQVRVPFRRRAPDARADQRTRSRRHPRARRGALSRVPRLACCGKAELPRELRDAFARTGTTHLLAASGFNITLVAGALGAALRPAGPRATAAGTIAAAFAMAVAAGLAPSIVRAALMSLAASVAV